MNSTSVRARSLSRAGFTIIELFVVILIVGVLAALAVPNLSSARQEALYATVQQDLRNLGAAQERYYQDARAYAQSLGELDFQPTEGTQVDVIPQSTEQGWAATAIHTALEAGQGCAIYLGDADPPPLPDGTVHSSGVGVLECSR